MRQAFSRWAIPCTRSAAMPMTVGWRGRSCKLLSYGAFSTSCMHCSSTTHASHVDATDGGKGPDGHPKRSSSLPRGAAGSSPPQLLGVSRVTAASIKDFMNTKVPLFLYFTMSGHAEVNAYTDLVCYQVDQANRRLQAENMADIYQEFGVDAGLGIKLGIVNCQEEPGLTHKFGVDPNCFPIIYFIRSSLVFDRLSGIVAESQVKESIDAFVDYAREESGKEKNGEGFFEQIKRHDSDDENAMTLMNVAHQALQKKELAKAKKLFQKAFDASVAEIRALEEKYSIHKKKMDNDLWFKLKKYGCYSTAPEALCGMAMCALASDDNEQAHSLVQRVRSEYPFATKDLRKVAEAVVRVELLILTGFDPNRDTFTSLLKYDSFFSDPVDFYKHHLRLAMAHYVENQPRLAIEECLKLIRAEVKLLPALKSGGIVDENLRLGPTAVTPARKALLGFFEALGPTHEEVVKGRKLMQLYV